MTKPPNNTPERKSSTLWLLLLTFVLPVIAAYAYFYFGENMDSNNNGDLIVPIIDIEKLGLTSEDGTVMNRDELTHKWRMFYIVGENCDTDCMQGMYYMRQINTALGKNSDRVQHMIIHLEPAAPDFQKILQSEYQKAIHAYTSNDTLVGALSSVDTNLPSNVIYLMDPIGNIMMRFTPDLSPKLILKDLNKLLKVSQIG